MTPEQHAASLEDHDKAREIIVEGLENQGHAMVLSTSLECTIGRMLYPYSVLWCTRCGYIDVVMYDRRVNDLVVECRKA